ncbi:MAG: acyl-CoA thioesterase domain-containing protein [Actinomycetota bacterium]
MSESVSFAHLIRLRPDGPSTFVGPPAPERFGRTYGGQFLAQALAAAAASLDGPKDPHSLHGYFVRAGSVDAPTVYRVESVREGRSFAIRSVVGEQDGAEVFRMTASFHAAEAGLDHQATLGLDVASLPAPSEKQPDYPAFAAGHPDYDPEGWDGARRPMEMRYINPPSSTGPEPVTEPQLMWVRITGGVASSPAPWQGAAALAYLSDGSLIDHALLPHGIRWFDNRLTGASLDHAMWFHRPAALDDGAWLLYDQRVEWTGAARGLVTGRFYDREGTLLATCSQEGLIRVS